MQEAVDRIGEFITASTAAAGRFALVLGLSGGIDSSLVAALGVVALGADRVKGCLLPCRAGGSSVADAELLAEHLGLRPETINLSELAESWRRLLRADDPLRLGNIMARLRMTALYDRAARHRGLVAGTGNRSEWLLGYFTRHGDAACDVAPIIDLYKTQVWDMARYLGLPARLIEKAPTADLWAGQTDEDEMGAAYADIDRVLMARFDAGQEPAEIKKVLPPELVDRVLGRVERNAFKRQTVPFPAVRELLP